MRRPARTMRGFGSLFIALCMALVAGSAGAVLHIVAGLGTIESTVIALVLLFAMLTVEHSVSRNRDRAEIADRIEGLARASADIAREVGELRYRVTALESAPAPALSTHDLKAGTEPLAREIGELAGLVGNLAQTIAAHEALLAGRTATAPLPAVPPPAEPPAKEPSGPFDGKSEQESAQLVREAIEAGRIETYLQPVVTLPQRKVRYYEALSRLRLGDIVLDAGVFLPTARAAGLLPRIDERLVHSSVQIVRRLASRSREIGLFLNIAPATLADRAVFSEILGYLDANRALAPALVLEFPQTAYRRLGAAEHNDLAHLADRGFRFSIDRIEDLRIDPRGLADRGVRFLKVAADFMLRQSKDGSGQIHPADLSELLGRYGIDLVADRIESEPIVVDLLDYDVRYGQGFLFSQPRPVRPEIMSGERIETDGNGSITTDVPPRGIAVRARSAALRGA